MKKHFILLSYLLIFSLYIENASAQAIFYASPTGSGSVCSETQPGSLASVRDKVRTINANMNGDIVVVLRGGEYNLTSPFVFSSSDGGTNNTNIWHSKDVNFEIDMQGRAVLTFEFNDDAAKICFFGCSL